MSRVGLLSLLALLLCACAEADPAPVVLPYADANISRSSNLIIAEGASDALSGLVIGPVATTQDRALVKFGLKSIERLSIRIDREGITPEWIAPKAINTIMIRSGTPAKITVYGKPGYRIEMASPVVVDCRAPFSVECLVEGDIRGVVARDLPEDPVQKVSELLDWISNEVDYSLSPSVTKEANRAFPPLNAAQIVRRYFDEDRLGGYCGATAIFAAKVLREFGIDAFTIDVGIPGGLTHVTVIWRSHDDHFYIADPSFNGTLVRNGRPADVFSDPVGVKFQTAPITKRQYLFRSGEPDDVLRHFIPDPKTNCVPGEDDLLVCRGVSHTIDDYFYLYRDVLDAHGLSSGTEAVPYLLRQGIFSVGEALNQDTRSLFIQRAKSAGIPMHRS